MSSTSSGFGNFRARDDILSYCPPVAPRPRIGRRHVKSSFFRIGIEDFRSLGRRLKIRTIVPYRWHMVTFVLKLQASSGSARKLSCRNLLQIIDFLILVSLVISKLIPDGYQLVVLF